MGLCKAFDRMISFDNMSPCWVTMNCGLLMCRWSGAECLPNEGN